MSRTTDRLGLKLSLLAFAIPPLLGGVAAIRAAETNETVDRFAGLCWCDGCD